MGEWDGTGNGIAGLGLVGTAGLTAIVVAHVCGLEIVPFELLAEIEPERADIFVSRNTVEKHVVLNFGINLVSSCAKEGPSSIVIRWLMVSFPAYGPSIRA